MTKYSQEEAIVEMKKTLTIEDVEEDENLPAGWRDKERSTKNSNETSVIVSIITEKGGIHRSFLSVLNMMRSKPAYNENEAQRLKTLTDEKHLIRIQKLETWNDDKPLPSGWKMSKTMGKVPKMYYLAPNGNQLESKQPASFHMIKENHPEGGINFMRTSWPLKEFEENIYLPQGWKFKETSSKTSNGISGSSLFTTNMGENNKDLPDGWKVKVPEGKNELKKVNEPYEISPNQGLSSSDKSLLKAKTMASPFQHELTQTDAHFKFIGRQKRTNKFASVQVDPTANSIKDQWFEEAVAGATLAQ